MGTNINSNLGSLEEMAEAAESTEAKTAVPQAETVPTVEAVTEAKTEEVVADNMETPKTE